MSWLRDGCVITDHEVCHGCFPFTVLGGSVTAGLAIYDTMQHVTPTISTWCIGQACSMGALLLAGGQAGMRFALPHSRIMIHQPSGQAGVS